MGGPLPPHFSSLLDPEVRRPFQAGGIWLVRPDGYVAMAASAAQDGWDEVGNYLNRLCSNASRAERALSVAVDGGAEMIRMPVA